MKGWHKIPILLLLFVFYVWRRSMFIWDGGIREFRS